MAALRSSTQRVANWLQDLLLGISTRGVVPATAFGHVYYATVPYSQTNSVLSKLHLMEEDVFVDVGCGKGRVVCLAARCNIRQAIGVEYSEALAALAEHNIRQLRGRRSPVEIVCKAAEDMDYSNATVLYFFNPFESSILDIVLQKIHSDRVGRPTRMAFVMESDEQRRVFSDHKWLTCYSRFDDGDEHAVALYCTGAN